MEYITILPSDLDLSTEHRYLRLPHPRTSLPQLYLPSCSKSSCTPDRLLEVAKISGSKRKTWFIGDSHIEAGNILIHHPVDPLFLVIPIILSLLNSKSNTPQPFQRLSDLISTACSSPDFTLPEAFSKAKATDRKGGEGSFNEDISRLLGMKSARRVFKICCERKVIPAAPPSPPSEDGESSHRPRGQIYYRPSRELVMKLLKLKVDYFSAEERSGCFDHLARSLGRDGLSGQGADQDLVKSARIKASVEHLAQWLPPSISIELLASYDLGGLSEHLMNLSEAALAAAQPIITGTKKEDKANAKRKLPAASRGVEALKKVNTASMNKLTSFFKPKDGKK